MAGKMKSRPCPSSRQSPSNATTIKQPLYDFLQCFLLSLAVSSGCESFLALTHMTQWLPLCFVPGEKHQRGQYPLVHSARVVNGVGDCDCIGDRECIAGIVLLVRQKKHLLQLQGMHDFCRIHFGLLLASLMLSQQR
jgi:hypothetical protein